MNGDGLWPCKGQRHSPRGAGCGGAGGLPAQVDSLYCEGTFCVPRLAVSAQSISCP